MASWWFAITFACCTTLGLLTRAVVWTARAQTDADAVALAYATRGSEGAAHLVAVIGARVRSVTLTDGIVSVVVDGRWGTASAQAEAQG